MFRVELSVDHAVSHGANLSPSANIVLLETPEPFPDITDDVDLGDDSDTEKKKMTTVMRNGIYDWKNSTHIVPYMGVGIGWGHLRHDFTHEADVPGQLIDESIDGSITALKTSDNVFVCQGVLGVGWDISGRFRVFIDYRLLGTSKSDLKLTREGLVGDNEFIEVRGHHTSHKINLGLSYFIK